MKEVTCEELKQLKDSNADIQLIDVREDYERDIAEIGGEHIPMGEISDNLNKISKDKKVVVYCRSGNRSAVIVNMLTSEHGFNNIYNLKGGLLEWASKIDPSVPKY